MQSGPPARWEELLGASGRWAGLRDAAVCGGGLESGEYCPD